MFYFFIYNLDSGLDSEFIQDGIHIGNGDNSPTVEDGTHQDETKNGHLGKCLFILCCTYSLSFVYFFFLLLFLFSIILADADIGDDEGKSDEG